MKYAAFTSLGLVIGMVAVGCTSLPGRLDVTPTLRQACTESGWTQNDSEIEALITAVETTRQMGISKTDAVISNLNTCGQFSADLAVACTVCGSAAIDQVYGE